MSQYNGSIKGVVKDSLTNTFLSGATVTLMLAKDSSLVSFSRTSNEGFFMIRNLAENNYRLLITHIGFVNLNKMFVVSPALREINFGNLLVVPASSLLKEVTVTQETPPVMIRNDTLEFNASSFKTKPNAVVEDLLKKLPGVQVDKDGKIKSNGQEIKKVLVDGKEFFGNDPKIATRNLPADAIEKVQVFDQKSDQSRFSGFDDGNSEKTINLTIKPDKKNGVFGKATAGSGDMGLYQGKFNVNSFSGERQVSAIGMVNNTNQQGFSFMDLLNFTGSLPGAGGRGSGVQLDMGNSGLPVQGSNTQGITSTTAGGLNYNNAWNKKFDLMSSYFYNRQQTTRQEDLRQQWLLPGNSFTTNRNNASNNSNENQRLNVRAEYKIDSVNSVMMASSINWQQSAYDINSRYQSVSDSGKLLNDGEAAYLLTGEGYSWNNNALFRHRFGKKGRTFSVNLSYNANVSSSNGSLMSQNNYYQQNRSNLQRLNQENNQANNVHTYGGVLSYTEPLSRKSLLEINYSFNNARSFSNKNTYDFDSLSGKHILLNETLSSKFLNDYTLHKTGINWRYQQKKFDFTIGAAIQDASMNSKFHVVAKDSALSRSYLHLLPNANLQYRFNQFRNIRIFYNAATRQPSVTQLQPITDNSDPVNVRTGNPDLRQEYVHRFTGNYISFDPYLHTSFFAALNAGMTINKIVDADQLTPQGGRLTKPVNVNGTYTVDLNTSWGFPLRKIKSKLNLNNAIANSLNAGFVNAEKNKINVWTASQEIVWNYNYKELLDLSAGTELIYNDVKYSLQNQQDINYWSQHYTFEINLFLSKGFSLASDLDYSTRNGLAQGYNITSLLWNAGIAKQVFKNKKGEFRLQAFDILNQNRGVSRSTSQNFVEDKSYNVLKRYWLLTFTYNISRFAGKNIAAPNSRSNNIEVIGAGKNK